MTYAIIENNIVINIAESIYALNENWIAVPSGLYVSIGDSYENNIFYDPNGNLRLTPEMFMAQEKITKLEEENTLKSAQIQALSDRNDFLEDCIAEMAGIIYG